MVVVWYISSCWRARVTEPKKRKTEKNGEEARNLDGRNSGEQKHVNRMKDCRWILLFHIGSNIYR